MGPPAKGGALSNMERFKIEVDQFSWIGGVRDDPDDLCLHGRVTVRFGKAVLEYFGTVSATALYLLKTLTEDKVMRPEEIQMVPCCGFFLIASEDLSSVSIIGCDDGLDWSTQHEDGGVRMTLSDGTSVWVSLEEYKAQVLAFADKVEAYYNACQPKRIPKEEFDRNGYLAFWKEWHRRYAEAAACPAASDGDR